MIGTQSAAELALMSRLGRPLQDGMVPVHLCGNVRCVNQRHLTEARPIDAAHLFGVMQGDAVDKEQARRGERNSNSVLDEYMVRQIKTMLAAGMTQKGIAKVMNNTYPELNLTQQNISSIATGRTWGHIDIDTTPTDDTQQMVELFDETIPPYLRVVVDNTNK